jgi:EamA-like transporter family
VPVWLALGWVVVLGTLAPYALEVGSLRHLAPTTTGIVAMIEPVIAAAVAWIWLDEVLSGVQLVGGAVVLLGVTLVQLAPSAPEPLIPPPSEGPPVPPPRAGARPSRADWARGWLSSMDRSAALYEHAVVDQEPTDPVARDDGVVPVETPLGDPGVDGLLHRPAALGADGGARGRRPQATRHQLLG